MKAKDFQALLLCGFLHNRQSFVKFAPDINEELFTEPAYQAVYSSMLSTGPDFTVPEIAQRVEAYGGLALLKDIRVAHRRYAVDKDFDDASVRKYALAVEKTGRQYQIKVLVKSAYEKIEGDKFLKDDEEYVSSLISSLVDIQYNKRARSGYKSYDEGLSEYEKNLHTLLNGGKLEERLETPFSTFNSATGGGLPKGLVVVGGMPGSGKTQWAWQTIIGVAGALKKQGVKKICAINSLEMSDEALAARGVLSAAEVDSALLRAGGYNNDQDAINRILKEIKRQKGLPIFIDDSDYLTSSMISSRVSGLRSRHGDVALIVTDFAELVSDKGDSPEQRVSSVFMNAKALSKRLDCTVILLSQLSRAVEMSGTRVPSMRHLRYSGMAEAAADMIILTYNPNYYESSGVKITYHPDMPPKDNRAYLIIAKHKEGEVGWMEMEWIPQFTRWADATSDKVKLKAYSAD